MGPLILLGSVAIVALVLVVIVWRKAQETTRTDSGGEGGDASLFYEGATTPSAAHDEGHCADASTDSSGGDCGSDGGGSD